MKKLIIFLLCIAVLGGGGFFGYKQYMKQKNDKIIVDVVPVSKMYEPASYFNYTSGRNIGMISDTNAQKLYIDSQKLVAKVCVEEGQEVKEGDTILEYDMTVVELELAQKENNIKVIEEEIKKANKDLENIKKYKPAENAPKQEINWNDYIPDIPEEPMPEETTSPEPQPVFTVDEVVPSFTPDDGNGSPETPFIINVKPSTKVNKMFILQMVSERRYAELCVYSDKSVYMYKWIIDPDTTPTENIEDWYANTGVSIDGSGAVTLDTGAAMPAKLSFARPKSLKYGASPDELIPDETTTDAEDMVVPEMPQQSYEMPDISFEEPKKDPNNHDYEYTKKEIENLIIKQEDEIKKKEFNLKKANRELETYKKRKKDGKEVAKIDGIVRKIGKPSSETDEEEEQEKTEEELYAAPDPDENAFAVIEGEGGIEAIFEVYELDLPKYSVGTKISINSFSGSSGTGEISKIDEMPLSYTSMDWGVNPNSSAYLVHAKLDDPDQFTLNDTIGVSLVGEDGEKVEENDSIYIPMHYVRQEGGDYYIMRASEDGTLEKRYISTGAVMDWGIRLIEVKGGISLKDKICFPYGKDVKEGVKTRETDTVLYPEGMGGY